MTMETNATKSKLSPNHHRKTLTKFLLPHKPNKVGVAVNRTQSAKETNYHRTGVISKRPLSLNVSNLCKEDYKGPLLRCSSISANNLTIPELEDEGKLHEKSISHESVMREAQVLYSIPTAQARQRNFLQGKLSANSLLGTNELNRLFPNREITIFVGTWNMNGQSPPK